MSEISITLTVAAVAVAVVPLIVIIIAIVISCKNAATMEEEKMPEEKLLPIKLNAQERAEYRAAIERMEQARAEIFGLHFKKATELKLNPSDIHIDTEGNVWKT